MGRILATVPFFFISLSVLGGILLGLAAGLASFVTTEHTDPTLPSSPIVQEYGFRISGKYGVVTFFLILSGAAMTLGGNIMSIRTFNTLVEEKPQSMANEEKKKASKEPMTKGFLVCIGCMKKLPSSSRFCPRCGTDLTPLERTDSKSQLVKATTKR
jgi:hypothetical protein